MTDSKRPSFAETHEKLRRHEQAEHGIQILQRRNRAKMRDGGADKKRLEIERNSLIALQNDIDAGKTEAMDLAEKLFRDFKSRRDELF
jgi:hypothetical protein